MPEISNPNTANLWVSDDGSLMHCRKIEIGSWNMDSAVSKTVSWGFTLDPAKLVSIAVVVFSDDGLTRQPLNRFQNVPDPSLVSGGISTYTQLSVVLYRRTGGVFDTAEYDDTAINRGYITVIFYD